MGPDEASYRGARWEISAFDGSRVGVEAWTGIRGIRMAAQTRGILEIIDHMRKRTERFVAYEQEEDKYTTREAMKSVYKRKAKLTRENRAMSNCQSYELEFDPQLDRGKMIEKARHLS